MTDNSNPDDKDVRGELLFRILARERYHHRRLNFYNRCNGLILLIGTVAIGLLLASKMPSTNSTLIFDMPLPELAGLIGAFSFLLGILWRPDRYAHEHTKLIIQHGELKRRIHRDPNSENHEENREKFNELTANTLPFKKVLLTLCFNDVYVAQGKKCKCVKIPFYYKWLAPFFSLYSYNPELKSPPNSKSE